MIVITFTVPGDIRGKRRVGQAGSHRFKPTVDRRGENAIAAQARQVAPPAPWGGAVGLHALIRVSVPPSWPQARQQAALAGAERPTGKPDWDNTGKLIADALNGVIWRDDAQVVDAQVVKVYAPEAGADVTVWQI
jgi:Holliday junction resolvase RusA-like endonuclease